MANERTYPMLPCRDIDEAISFYEALGFKKTYRQVRPNPSAVVAREDIHIHLFGMENFNPADSYGSVIIVVPDPDALYNAFAAGLRTVYGKLPIAGFPRILRPRKRYGTVRGFSVVDVGGNWLRIFKDGDTEEEANEENANAKGLAQIVLTAARLGDAHGDEGIALKTLESGITRFKDAPAIDRARAFLYRAELAMRMKNTALAQESLALIQALTLSDEEQASIAEELARTTELLAEHQQAE